jgi:MFS superfamily sulfate permease-like transporter
MDATIATTFAELHEALARRGSRLVFCGIPSETMAVFERSGAADRIGRDNLFTSSSRRLQSMGEALRSAHHAHEGDCPVQALLREV